MKYHYIYNCIRSNSMSIQNPATYDQLVVKLDLNDSEIIRNKLIAFLKNFKSHWNDVNRKAAGFEKKYAKWLDSNFIPFAYVPPATTTIVTTPLGRPTLNFDESSLRSKYRKVADMVHYSANQLSFATKVKFGKNNKPKKAKLEEKLLVDTISPSCMSTVEALALILDCNSTKASYQLMKNKADSKECNLYPAYNCVRMAKDQCYPKNISITDCSASVPLQDLLDHTTTRLLETQTGVLNANECNRLTLTYKAGFDGSSGHSIYKQICNDDECTWNLKSEESLFITCFAPSELSSIVNDKKIILWRNS
ncbi:uncharacterized protein LOC124807453 isoform X2 [Hydra vulgaris]|uniref:Uncharacterized protein LOC124807453 isoform X2 n=1 Tax=Hydra vulgaris TaxID=6087 RepID=A0ABM4DP45_HYDVU